MDTVQDQKPIIVGVDGSPSSVDALRRAAEIAKAEGRPLEAITAWQFPMGFDGTLPPEVWSPEREAQLVLSSGIALAFPHGRPDNLSEVILPGPTAGVLIKRSASASLLVLGSRGRGGFAGLLLGSVSTACAQHAHCPVLIMHSSESPEQDAEHAHA